MDIIVGCISIQDTHREMTGDDKSFSKPFLRKLSKLFEIGRKVSCPSMLTEPCLKHFTLKYCTIVLELARPSLRYKIDAAAYFPCLQYESTGKDPACSP